MVYQTSILLVFSFGLQPSSIKCDSAVLLSAKYNIIYLKWLRATMLNHKPAT